MSSYWDAALRVGRGLHGTAEPRPRARFEDDAAPVTAFEPVEIEQEVRAPVIDTAVVDRPLTQGAEKSKQPADKGSADKPVAEPLVRSLASDHHDLAVSQQGNEIPSSTADSQPNDQQKQRATITPTAEPVVQQILAAGPAPEANKAHAEVAPIAIVREQVSTTEAEIGSASVPSMPIPQPVFIAPEPQNAEPHPIVVAAEPVIPEVTQFAEEQELQAPTLLIAIDSIDIRIGVDSAAPQPLSRRTQPPIVTLQDYLARRSGGNA
jgi:hypothetical protein